MSDDFRVEHWLAGIARMDRRGSSGTETFEIGRLFDGLFQPRSLICRVIKKKEERKEREREKEREERRKGRKGRGKEGRKELACH